MKEHPILMSTSMVQGIKEDRKTMTRRVKGVKEINESPDDWRTTGIRYTAPENVFNVLFVNIKTKEHRVIKLPYGYKGDLLWVRESGWVDNNYIRGLNDPHLFWKADYPEYDEHTRILIKNHTNSFPSIHMYKVFARIWLEITGVRVERLQDITKKDCIEEGIEPEPTGDDVYKNYLFRAGMTGSYRYIKAKDSYKSLWQSING